eukprot:NODE_24_length_41419_cov_0.818780.p31 type:complete len:136 gc:universal NODE_24_length_41419_cov_0.818780:33080-33487(+)
MKEKPSTLIEFKYLNIDATSKMADLSTLVQTSSSIDSRSIMASLLIPVSRRQIARFNRICANSGCRICCTEYVLAASAYCPDLIRLSAFNLDSDTSIKNVGFNGVYQFSFNIFKLSIFTFEGSVTTLLGLTEGFS